MIAPPREDAERGYPPNGDRSLGQPAT